MKRSTTFVLPALVVSLALALTHITGLPAYAQKTERAKKLGDKLMCMCNCNQILTQCNHVGCSTSTAMLKKLDHLVARNEPDDLTLQSFVQEYGQSVLAEPPAKGFSLTAWLIPVVAFGTGTVIVCLVILSWRRRVAVAPAAPDISPELLARTRHQADQETEE